MDLFDQRAQAILETARMGVSNNVSVTFQYDGGMYLVMGDASELNRNLPPASESGTSTYQMMRKGREIFVTGRQGEKSCEISATAIPCPPTLLLSNQALYQVSPGLALCG